MTGAVLVVDDSLTIRMSLAELLDEAGFSVAVCASADEARQVLLGKSFDLAIVDHSLPDGADLLRDMASTDLALMMLTSETDLHDLAARAGSVLESKTAQKSILIIDDSITFREALKEMLEGAGYRIHVAVTGEEGLRLAAELRPTAVVVDGELPGIDGPTVIRRMRLDAALRQMPCLLLTASEDSGAEIKAFDAGADAFVRKGEDADMILARLNAVLRSAADQRDQGARASLLGPKKILAVDDSETYLQALVNILGGEGYDMILARSGEEALEMLAIHTVDCILLDLMMPGIDGRETCRRVKAAPVIRDIPIIMLTAIEDRATMIECLGAGADDYIAKTNDFEVLRARVLAQIRRKQSQDETRQIREKLLLKELEAAEASAAREIAEARAALVEELEFKNQELESFSYSVAHDLRAPLRSIDGFSAALLEDYKDLLDEGGQRFIGYIRELTLRMSQLIDDLLSLSRVGRADFQRSEVDLSELAGRVVEELCKRDPGRQVDCVIAKGILVSGDPRLLKIVLENLIGNAWKFTGKREGARIELGATDHGGRKVYVLKDNGAGFDMAYASKLFGVFQRLHSAGEFEGTGVGLATVQRVIRRHGGRIWAESEVGRGATFFFTLDGTGAGT